MNGQSEILSEVIAEREAQDREHGGPQFDDTHTVHEWVYILARHLGLACSDRAVIDYARYRKQLVRLAAVAVAAIESHDRVYAPKNKPAGTDTTRFSDL